jgi:4-amino-4-deoxy-L-arabinose transferase-like glycosyltransferase
MSISQKSANSLWKFLLPILGLWVVLYGSFSLGKPPLNDGPNTIHAEIAREMLTRHDLTHAYANGFPVKSTSRVLDWSIAFSYRLFGVADWSARLPIALTILALIIIVFFFARKLFGGNAAALYAALFFLVWPGTFLSTRELDSAPFLCLGTMVVAFVLWTLLIEKRLALGTGIAASAITCALILLTASWPEALLPLAIVAICWVFRSLPDETKQRVYFLWSWAICAYIFTGFFDRQEHTPLNWIIPLPPLALVLGDMLASNETYADESSGRRVARWIFGIGLVVALILIAVALHRPIGFGAHQVDVFIAQLVAAAAVIAGVTGNLIYRSRNKPRIANCFLAGTLGGILVAIQVGLILASPLHSSQILADAIRPELNSTDIVAIDGKYPQASSLVFYLERPVLLAVPASAAATSPQAGTVAIDRAWSGTARVFLWTSAEHPLAVPGQSYVVASSGGKQILSNERNSGGASF